MKFLKLASVATALFLSTSVNAAIVTQGYLTTNDDNSTNIITDSLNNVEYLRFNVLADLTYAQTLTVLDTQDGGNWSIATSSQAVDFTEAFLESTSCTLSGLSDMGTTCGTATGWYDGKLGDNFFFGGDVAWFLDDSEMAGMMSIVDSGTISLSVGGSIAGTDTYAAPSSETVSWLLVRTSPVPVPAAVWLFGSGLIGLVGFARRRKV